MCSSPLLLPPRAPGFAHSLGIVFSPRPPLDASTSPACPIHFWYPRFTTKFTTLGNNHPPPHRRPPFPRPLLSIWSSVMPDYSSWSYRSSVMKSSLTSVLSSERTRSGPVLSKSHTRRLGRRTGCTERAVLMRLNQYLKRSSSFESRPRTVYPQEDARRPYAMFT